MICDSEDREDDESNRNGSLEVTWHTWINNTDNPCKRKGKANATTEESCQTMDPLENVLQLVCDMITASAHKMREDTATANPNIKSDVTGNIALLSDFDLIIFQADGSTMEIDSFASPNQSLSS
jgi:hypothetical protein